MRHFAVTALAVVLLAGASEATVFRHAPGTSKWKTRISGLAGNYEQHVAAETRGIYMLTVWEKSDDPLQIDVYNNGLDSANGQYEHRESLEVGDVWSGWLLVPSSQHVNIGEDRYVISVQVCVNNEKIKGVRLWGARITATGEIQPTQSDDFERPNCNGQWRQRVSCGARKVAAGVRAYYRSRSKGFSGLTLRCSKIQPR